MYGDISAKAANMLGQPAVGHHRTIFVQVSLTHFADETCLDASAL